MDFFFFNEDKKNQKDQTFGTRMGKSVFNRVVRIGLIKNIIFDKVLKEVRHLPSRYLGEELDTLGKSIP